jgi:hypothetical protein
MPTPFPVLTPAANVDEVLVRIDAVIAWSIANQSRLGYFAALYKRITRAIKLAVQLGKFQDGPRMERFDVTFANRYFAALSGYFYPATNDAPTHCWRVAFDAAQLENPIVVQHMLAGVNAHINLDLGIAAFEIARPLEALHDDFNTVNAVLGEQAGIVLDEIDRISPVLAALYDFLKQYEIELIADGLVLFRDSAWSFATLLSIEPRVLDRALIMKRDFETAYFGSLVMQPPGLLASFVAAIAARESRDVVHNIEVLNGIASEPLVVTVPASPGAASAEDESADSTGGG